MICVIKITANAISRVPHAFFGVEHFNFARGHLLSIGISITTIEGNNTCDFMYKVS